MAEQLVDDVRLRSVQRRAVVSNVLRRMENLEGEAVEELSLGEEASDGLEAPACLRLEELGDRVKLRDVVFSETDVLLKLLNSPPELLAGVCLEELLEP
jgi:hypothetical protein